MHVMVAVMRGGGQWCGIVGAGGRLRRRL